MAEQLVGLMRLCHVSLRQTSIYSVLTVPPFHQRNLLDFFLLLIVMIYSFRSLVDFLGFIQVEDEAFGAGRLLSRVNILGNLVLRLALDN